ncbi:MAG: aromatic ring-hydroxylating dioxygenase subunit alpha [Cyanobacteria bacterium P01_D01_bin.1]
MTALPFESRLQQADYLKEKTYAQTHQPLREAMSLLADAYRQSAFYDLEQVQVFATSWVAVGYVEQIANPGQVLVAEVAGQSVMITRDRNHQLQAFYNVCRHRGSQLVKSACQLNRFQCPYHGWQYSLRGDCTAFPMFERKQPAQEESSKQQNRNLLSVQVDTWGCLVFINLDAQAMPLRGWLGDLPQKLAGYRLQDWTLAHQRDYSIQANWKLIAENFMEYYHLPWVHPELVQVSRIEDHYRDQGTGMYTGMRTTPIAANTAAGGWQGLPTMQGLSSLESLSGRFICLFPNVCLSILPNHAFVMLLKPSGVDLTLESTALLLPPADSTVQEQTHLEPSCLEATETPALEALVEFWDLVNRQDIEIVETVQKGLKNGAYQGGYLSETFEEPLHRFQNMVIDRMIGRHDWVPAGDRTPTSLLPHSPTHAASHHSHAAIHQ